MAEIITLTTPIPSAADFRVAEFNLNVRGSIIHVIFAEFKSNIFTPSGREIIVVWTGVVADNLMIALNKANLTIQSLHQRIMTQAINDGKLQGTQSGLVP